MKNTRKTTAGIFTLVVLAAVAYGSWQTGCQEMVAKAPVTLQSVLSDVTLPGKDDKPYPPTVTQYVTTLLDGAKEHAKQKSTEAYAKGKSDCKGDPDCKGSAGPREAAEATLATPLSDADASEKDGKQNMSCVQYMSYLNGKDKSAKNCAPVTKDSKLSDAGDKTCNQLLATQKGAADSAINDRDLTIQQLYAIINGECEVVTLKSKDDKVEFTHYASSRRLDKNQLDYKFREDDVNTEFALYCVVDSRPEYGNLKMSDGYAVGPAGDGCEIRTDLWLEYCRKNQDGNDDCVGRAVVQSDIFVKEFGKNKFCMVSMDPGTIRASGTSYVKKPAAE